MPYAVLFQPAAQRELARLERADHRRVLAAIEALAHDPRPHGCAKMSAFRDVWRMRIGVLRVIYRILDRELIVQVVRIGHRREVYR